MKDNSYRWIREKLNPDFEHATRTRKLIIEKNSKYQKIQVFDTDIFGKMLVLDGAVQTTEKDQHYYHEMLVGIPVLLKRDIEKALIIGGGDGGALRAMIELGVSESWMCELDETVVQICNRYLSEISNGSFSDKNTKLVFEDGYKFLNKKKDFFDAIFVDSSDPIGAAKKLYSPEFYKRIKSSLKDEGVVACQSGSPWLQPDIGKAVFNGLGKYFKYVSPYLGMVPSYPGVAWLYTFGSDFIDPKKYSVKEIKKIMNSSDYEFKYLTEDIVKTAFNLPKWAENTIKKGEW